MKVCILFASFRFDFVFYVEILWFQEDLYDDVAKIQSSEPHERHDNGSNVPPAERPENVNQNGSDGSFSPNHFGRRHTIAVYFTAVCILLCLN